MRHAALSKQCTSPTMSTQNLPSDQAHRQRPVQPTLSRVSLHKNPLQSWQARQPLQITALLGRTALLGSWA